MTKDEEDYTYQWIENLNVKIKDIEEKQKLIKDNLILIGENLIDTKEKTNEEIIGIKKEMEILKDNMERMLSFIETLSEEIPKFARKEHLEILSNQIKMFDSI